MIFLMVFYILSTLTKINSNTVTSPQIRNVATKTSESRLIPQRVDYRNTFHPYFQQQNRFEQAAGPLKSYVIYDEHPIKIFKEWKANPPADYVTSAPQNYLELRRQQNVEFPPNYYFQNEQQILPPSTPTLAYRSVYSNIIKVFDNSLEDFDQNRFHGERYIQPFESGVWRSQNPNDPNYSQYVSKRPLYYNFKLPENFPKVFSPNEKFHFPSFSDAIPPPPKFFYPQEGFYDTYTINYNKETARNPEEVEVLPEVTQKQKNNKKTFLCSFIRVNQRQFPENGGPCARNDQDSFLISPEYPDYSSLPNYKIPVEHRRQHFQMKIIKRSEPNQSNERRRKRDAGLGYGYGGWGSPFGYENGYDGYFGGNYPGSEGYRNSYNSGYSTKRSRNQGYKNKYYSGSRYDDYDEDYQNNDDSNSRGLTGYLTNGGRRYKNRKNNNDDEDEEDDNENNSSNHEDDSDEEMERMNSNRRDTNDRRNNDDSRDRRRNNNNNNNNNEDDDYRDSRRNNNRSNNSKRYNNNNSSSSNRRYNDRYDYNNRNRYYGNSNGYNNNGYGSGYGSYGNNYGGGYGNGGYGSGYGSNGGYSYGGYGNGFGSF